MIRILFLSALLLSFFACRKAEPVVASNDVMVTAEGKKDMILLTDRPPNLETPLKYFLLDYTPNDVFFVRWHLPVLPNHIQEDTFRLRVHGAVDHELALSLADLKTKFPKDSIVALAACAGNARSFFDPKVPGGQWKNGAMGNAKWTGVRLKDILGKAGLKKEAYEITFNGMDLPALPSVPDFVKSLKVDHAMDGEVMIAYAMNDEPLPILNGYPLKLVVPGWYATYWVGMLNEITVVSDTFNGFWMKKAYLKPKGISNGTEQPDSLSKNLEPVNTMDVRSIFVTPEPDSILNVGAAYEIQGLAFDGGQGITNVEISLDNEQSWQNTSLDPEIGKYAWRRWRYLWTPKTKGAFSFKVRATNASGETQPEHQWNRSGYLRNEIETLQLTVK
jgi:sulfite dehydrogenase (cytochrome) subunit A